MRTEYIYGDTKQDLVSERQHIQASLQAGHRPKLSVGSFKGGVPIIAVGEIETQRGGYPTERDCGYRCKFRLVVTVSHVGRGG